MEVTLEDRSYTVEVTLGRIEIKGNTEDKGNTEEDRGYTVKVTLRRI